MYSPKYVDHLDEKRIESAFYNPKSKLKTWVGIKTKLPGSLVLQGFPGFSVCGAYQIRTNPYFCTYSASISATSVCLFGYRCEYVLSVVLMSSCPSRSLIVSGDTPNSIRWLAWLCRYGIITTNRKSLYFQGVWAFVVFYSIPFPSWKLTKTIKKKGGCFINDKI